MRQPSVLYLRRAKVQPNEKIKHRADVRPVPIRGQPSAKPSGIVLSPISQGAYGSSAPVRPGPSGGRTKTLYKRPTPGSRTNRPMSTAATNKARSRDARLNVHGCWPLLVGVTTIGESGGTIGFSLTSAGSPKRAKSGRQSGGFS